MLTPVSDLCSPTLRPPLSPRVLCCSWCFTAVTTKSIRTKWCGAYCQNRATALRPKVVRSYKVCSKPFDASVRGLGNTRHCSLECSTVSARKARAAFARKHPTQMEAYRETHRKKQVKDTTLGRLRRKYPWLPNACEACGETRVLDVAHRPGHERRGAWISMRVNTPERIWILCPLCHALLDRCGYTPEQLGIRDRAVSADVLEAA